MIFFHINIYFLPFQQKVLNVIQLTSARDNYFLFHDINDSTDLCMMIFKDGELLTTTVLVNRIFLDVIVLNSIMNFRVLTRLFSQEHI